MDTTRMSAVALREAIVSGKLSTRQVVENCLEKIASHDHKLKTFLSLDQAGALRTADAIAQKKAKGETLGKLAGVPVALKDNLCMQGLPTTCASKMLENFMPPYDAHVVARIKAEDGIVIGKTNLDEFAMGSSTENSGFFTTHNPWDRERAPGGSSGGSAAAVAAGFVPLAVGSDTGGSIRQPASFCGCIGFKPTYGMVSRYGLIAFGSSLDQIGPFARNISDAALLMNVISGPDKRDATISKNTAPDFLQQLNPDLSGLRIGISSEYSGSGLNSEVEQQVKTAISGLEQLGASVKEVSLPYTKYAVPVYYIIATAEASSNLARYDGAHYGYRCQEASDIFELFSKTRKEGFGSEVKRRIMLGTYALSAGYYDAYYLKALKVRTLMAEDFKKAFSLVDIIVTPTSPTVAFRLGERAADPLSMYLSDIYTISANLAGIPGISLPCGFADGLPVGLQILAPHFNDAKLLGICKVLEDKLEVCPKIAPL